MKKILFLLFFTATFSTIAFAQTEGYKSYPNCWWVGMKNPKLQLMLHGDAIANAKGGFTISYPGIKIEKVNKVENVNYVFLDLNISPAAKPGWVKIKVNRESAPFDIAFELKARRKGNGQIFAQGVTAKDFVYLILPDRFSNGDESNDRVPGMRDQSMNRDTVFNRHGRSTLFGFPAIRSGYVVRSRPTNCRSVGFTPRLRFQNRPSPAAFGRGRSGGT